MDLLLVRCADIESENGVLLPEGVKPDPVVSRDAHEAGLSARGERHSRRLAAWLGSHAPRDLQIFSSPAKGSRQMAGLIAEGVGDATLPPIVSRLLAPGGNAADILGAIGWPHDHRAALVVAHQPALGALASLLLTGHEAPLAFKRSALWWFSNRHRDGELQTVLRCALTPDLLKGSGRADKSDVAALPKVANRDLPEMVELLRTRLSSAIR